MLRKMGFRIYLDAENETIVQYEGKFRKIIFSCLERDGCWGLWRSFRNIIK